MSDDKVDELLNELPVFSWEGKSCLKCGTAYEDIRGSFELDENFNIANCSSCPKDIEKH